LSNFEQNPDNEQYFVNIYLCDSKYIY
jgi:hypothetical protein